MVVQHAMPRTRCPFKFQNRYPIRRNMASACIQLFFVGIPKAVPAADVFPPKPLQIHLVYIAPKDLPRAYALCANVGVASVGHERTKGESRGLFARCERTTAAAAAVGELLSSLWRASVAYRPLFFTHLGLVNLLRPSAPPASATSAPRANRGALKGPNNA